MSSPRMLVLSPIPDQGASYRFRVAQYVPYLRQRGFDVTVVPFETAAGTGEKGTAVR